MNTELDRHLDIDFPAGYWDKWRGEFGHSFVSTHKQRTLEYDDALNEIISHKKVLEVGGFPGLETSWLLYRKCQVETIDSPNFRRDYYLDWCKNKNVISYEHDIVLGAPSFEHFWDVSIVSDVFMHIEGFPIDFMKWLIKNSETVILSNYSQRDGTIFPAIRHDLHQGFSIPSTETLTEFMKSNGAKLVNKFTIPSARDILVFEK